MSTLTRNRDAANFKPCEGISSDLRVSLPKTLATGATAVPTWISSGLILQFIPKHCELSSQSLQFQGSEEASLRDPQTPPGAPRHHLERRAPGSHGPHQLDRPL